MFIFDRQANRLRLKVDGEYTRSPRLCRQLFSDILTNQTIALKEFVWDHILQEPSSLVAIIHMELPLLTKTRLFTCWFRFTPQAYRLAYQDVHIRVLISFKKLLFATSVTANPIPMLEQFSTGLFINAFLLKSPSTIDCPKKWEIWTKVLHRFFPHHTFSAEMVYGVLRYLHVPCFVRQRTKRRCKSSVLEEQNLHYEEVKPLSNLTHSVYNLTQKSNYYYETLQILKGEGQSSDYERQSGHEALIYLSEKKLEYRKKRLDCEELQMIEILEIADESELECMEGCCSILKTVFHGSKYKFKLGEQACIESKNVRAENEKTFGSSQTLDSIRNIMGRRIDLLLSSFETNISSCEWKAENVSPSVARSQESEKVLLF
ncbi:hypothetical protein G6F43_004634 [Rhizopus delemar]|nr:hypothetical protein G6F43_004634 [Rhizopus delemar]